MAALPLHPLPLVAPFIVIAAVVTTIDALKTFDTIYVITGGGPGTVGTIDLYLYLQGVRVLQHRHRFGCRRRILRHCPVLALLLLTCGEDEVDVTSAPRHPAAREGACRAAARRLLRKSASGCRCSYRVASRPRVPVDVVAVDEAEIDNIAYPPIFIPESADIRQLRVVWAEQHRSLHAGTASSSPAAPLVALLIGVTRASASRASAPSADRSYPALARSAGALLSNSAFRRIPVPAAPTR
jgi:hypothetical protein